MKIERKKVESVGEFSPRTRARLVALLGLSAALSVPAAEPQGRDAVIPAVPTDSTNTITQDSTVSLEKDSTSSESGNYDWNDSPGGIIVDPYEDELTDEEMVNNAIDAAVERIYFMR